MTPVTHPVKVYPIIHAPPPSLIITLPSTSDQDHLSSSVKCSIWCDIYKRTILIVGLILLLAIIIIVVVLSRSGGASSSTSTTTNPCESYRPEDFASSVSLTCFRYMWANAGCKSTVPDGYAGWYLRSPDGGKTVLCIPPKTGALCGAGSFGTLQNSVWRCDLDFRGY